MDMCISMSEFIIWEYGGPDAWIFLELDMQAASYCSCWNLNSVPLMDEPFLPLWLSFKDGEKEWKGGELKAKLVKMKEAGSYSQSFPMSASLSFPPSQFSVSLPFPCSCRLPRLGRGLQSLPNASAPASADRGMVSRHTAPCSTGRPSFN